MIAFSIEYQEWVECLDVEKNFCYMVYIYNAKPDRLNPPFERISNYKGMKQDNGSLVLLLWLHRAELMVPALSLLNVLIADTTNHTK